MKKYILLMIIMPIVLFAQAQRLNLKESLAIGLKNSKDLKISYSKVVGASAQVTSAGSQLLPQIGFSASYMRLSNIPAFTIEFPPFIPNPVTISPVILDNYTTKLSLQQPLFTGFRLSSLKNAAESNLDAAKKDYQADLNETAFKIQNAFWNYYKAQQNDSLIQENLDQISKHLKDTKNFAANGQATKNDYLKLEVEYSSTKLQKIEADNNLDIARMIFNQAIGLPTEAPTLITEDSLMSDSSNLKLEDLINQAENDRNELKSLAYRLDASSDNVNAANSAWFPAVYLVGDYYYSKPNQRFLPAVDHYKDTWDVGVTLSWTVWNWGYNSSQAAIAEQNKIQTETSLAQLKDAVEIEVNQNYFTLNRASDKINVSKLGVSQAEENYRITQEKYNSLMATSTDLIDAEVSLLQSKTNYINSVVDYQIAKIRLEKSIGNKIY